MLITYSAESEILSSLFKLLKNRGTYLAESEILSSLFELLKNRGQIT